MTHNFKFVADIGGGDSPRPVGIRRFSSLRVVQRSHSSWDIHSNHNNNGGRKRSLQVSAASVPAADNQVLHLSHADKEATVINTKNDTNGVVVGRYFYSYLYFYSVRM